MTEVQMREFRAHATRIAENRCRRLERACRLWARSFLFCAGLTTGFAIGHATLNALPFAWAIMAAMAVLSKLEHDDCQDKSALASRAYGILVPHVLPALDRPGPGTPWSRVRDTAAEFDEISGTKGMILDIVRQAMMAV